jgi:hypothetical protein
MYTTVLIRKKKNRVPAERTFAKSSGKSAELISNSVLGTSPIDGLSMTYCTSSGGEAVHCFLKREFFTEKSLRNLIELWGGGGGNSSETIHPSVNK